MLLNFVIWNVKPQILDFGSFEIRYYSLLFALGFVLGYLILYRIFRKEGINQDLLDKLTIYMVLSTIIGARLGHCLFYEFGYYSHHPLEIILPWRGTIGKDFEFTGYQGLASHGAAIGILLGVFLFSRKTKLKYLWTMDLLVIVTALGGGFIRLGNLMNSEIYGKPTKSQNGFVFTHDLSRFLTKNYDQEVKAVSYEKIVNDTTSASEGVPINIKITFSRKVRNAEAVKQFADFFLPNAINQLSPDNNVLMPKNEKLVYQIDHVNGEIVLTSCIIGVPRYPSQIFESSSYLIIFIILLLVYWKYNKQYGDGYLLGIFLVLVFSARFFIEFLKENQEAFENTMKLNMGQLLSIPFIIIGIYLVVIKWPKKVQAA